MYKDLLIGDTNILSIISTVLGWDNGKLKRRVSQIEHMNEAPAKEQLAILKEYANKTHEEQEQCRLISGEFEVIFTEYVESNPTVESQGQSIVTTILSASSVTSELSQKGHSIAME